MLGKSLASIVRDLMLLSRGAKGVCKVSLSSIVLAAVVQTYLLV